MPRKPMLSVDDLISHMKEKGILFDIMTEDAAKEYLGKNNNYFKLSSYRKNYSKALSGKRMGQYEHLDFAYLIELARIDVEVRHILLKMCLDIEHFLKVSLIKAVENHMQVGTGEDGYKIVTDFILDVSTISFKDRTANVSKRAGATIRKINQNVKNPYCDGLLKKYAEEMPIWAYVELISFGDLLDLIDYYSRVTGWSLPVDRKSLDRVRQIRNAAAHNNCIINDLSPSNEIIKTPMFITKFVSDAHVGQASRDKKLSNKRINQIVHLLYVYDNVVTSANTRRIRLNELNDLLSNRMTSNGQYFKQNALLSSTREFFVKLVANIMKNS